MPRFQPKPPGPRKSATSTPGLGDEAGGSVSTIAERLNYADLPRPFRNPYFTSRLAIRTASASTSTITKKNAKQILTLERERLAGGDGFLTAAQTAAKARGEVIEVGSKKKKEGGGGGAVGGKRGNIANLRRGNKPGAAAKRVKEEEESVVDSRRTSPGVAGLGEEEEEEDVKMGEAGAEGTNQSEGVGTAPVEPMPAIPQKEIITYHTPTAPPSLLPPKKYCDITGLHAAYTDPRTKLRYKGLEVWHVVRGMGPGGDQAYLALRGAQTALK